jgi:hypothetical protein
MIHLAFRASNADIFRLIQNCPKIKAIQLPSSYRRTLSQVGEMFLKMQGVELIEGDIWGHRSDISDYFNVDDELYERSEQLRSRGLSDEEIARDLSREMKLSPNLIKYVIWQGN